MSRRLVAVPFILFCLITGCYDVPFTIGNESNARIADELIGEWQRSADEGPTRTKQMVITRKSDTPWYDMELLYTDGKEEAFRFILHQVGPHLIASSRQQGGAQKGYSLFSLLLPENGSSTLTALSLDESAPRFDTKEELLQFLRTEDSKGWFKRKLIFKKSG